VPVLPAVPGCGNHLWQDLGRLMQRNFSMLSALNVHDMKWKKFLCKQLCAAEGVHVCRAPSCEVCIDYESCSGPEA
jgi:nitrogen fixation protein NifQ